MKTYSYRKSAFILMSACLLFLNGHTAMGADARASHGAAEFAFMQRVADPARLIIRRIPNLGNHIFVNLYIDGVPVAGIAYGHTYETLLRAGRHVLSVRATPNARWLLPWEKIVHVRSGQTYAFTATGNHSGNLILRED